MPAESVEVRGVGWDGIISSEGVCDLIHVKFCPARALDNDVEDQTATIISYH